MLKKYRLYLLAALLVAVLAFSLPRALTRQVNLVVDGQPRSVTTAALTVAGVLRAAGVTVSSGDRLEPAGGWLWTGKTITLDTSRPVTVIYNHIPLTLNSSARLPGELMAQAGVLLNEGDQLFMDGLRVLPEAALPPAAQYTITVRKAIDITLVENGQKLRLRSAAPTLGQALWEAGIRLYAGDRLIPAAATPLTGALEATLRRAVPLTISVQGQELFVRSAAETVGGALAEANIALQGLDYSRPAATEPLESAAGKIEVIRVREEVALTVTSIPFTNEYQPDPDTELDQRSVIQAGEVGQKVTRERIRYENGQEVSRETEAEWVASQPKAQIVGTGTKAVIKTLDTPDGKIEYYRAVSVYATSYSPCRQGMGRCSLSTSSGIPLAKGVVAVTLAWYNQFAGQRVYIPGYGVGVIGDVGGGIPGRYWIDLGYGEDDFVNWHDNVMLYFLTPVPADAAWTLP